MDKQKKLENKGVKFTPISAIELKIEFPTLNYEIVNVDNKKELIDYIIHDSDTVNISDRYSIDLSNSINNYNLNYKVNAITSNKTSPKSFRLLESIYNKTTLFVLPLIFKNKIESSYVHEVNNRNTGYLINSFITSNFLKEKNEFQIYLLLKFSKSELFKKQESFLLKHDLFIRQEDINPNYVIYEFAIPAKFIYDYKLLLDGKYSQISQHAKDRIINFYKGGNEEHIVENILNKNSALVQQIEKDLDVDMTGLEVCGKFSEQDILTKDLL